MGYQSPLPNSFNPFLLISEIWVKGLSPFLAAILLFQMIGCGTLIYTLSVKDKRAVELTRA